MNPIEQQEFSIAEAKHFAEAQGFRRSIIWWRTMVSKLHIKAEKRNIHGVSLMIITREEVLRVVKDQPHLKVIIQAVVFALIFSSCFIGNAFALSDHDAIKTVMGEARGEGYKGMLAVAEVLRRRNSTKGFYGFKAKFKEPKWVWDIATKAWNDSTTTNITHGATHFEGVKFKTPCWAKDMKVVAVIGNQKFFASK